MCVCVCVASQAEHLFTPAQYETTLGFVLERCDVDGAKLEQTLALSRAAIEDKKLSLSLSRMTVIQGRPRLRDRVTSVLKTDERKAQVVWICMLLASQHYSNQCCRWIHCWTRGSRTLVSATSTSSHPH